MRLGELLIEAGAITPTQLDAALRRQAAQGGRLGTNLIDLGFLTEDTFSKVLAAQLRLPRIGEAALDKLSRSVLDLVSVELAARHSVCPVRLDGPRLHLAMSDPLDKAAIAAVHAHTGSEIRPLVAPHGVVRHALQKHYGISPTTRSSTIALRSESAMPILRSGQNPLEQAPVFDPYAALPNDLQLAEVDEQFTRTAATPPAARHKPPPPVVEAPKVAAPGTGLGPQLVAVQTIDDVGDLVVRFVQGDFSRSVLLIVRGDNLVGWRVDGAGTNASAVRSFTVPLSALPALSHALTEGKPIITRDTSLVLPFIALLGDPAGATNLVLPLMHKGRPAACVGATGGKHDVEQRAKAYTHFADKVGLGFQLVMLRKQILE